MAGAQLAGSSTRPAAPPDSPVPAASEEVASAFYVGTTALELGIFDAARGALERLTRLAPGEPAGWAHLGLLELRAGNPEAARRRLEQAERLAPESAAIQALLGLVASRAGHPDAACEHYRLAARLDPADVRARFALAAELERVGEPGDLVEAAEALAEVCERRPTSAAALLERARVAARAGDADGVRVALGGLANCSAAWPVAARAELTAVGRGDGPMLALRLARLRNLLTPLPGFQSDLDELDAIQRRNGLPLAAPLRLAVAAPEPAPAAWPGALVRYDLLAGTEAREQAGGLAALPVWSGPEGASPLPRVLVVGADGARIVRAVGIRWGEGPAGPAAAVGAHSAAPTGALSVDWDHDLRPDLVLAGPRGLGLFRQLAGGGFEDVSARSGLGADVRAAAWVAAFALDLDLDGDLDLVLAPAEGPPTALRNRSDGTFELIAASPLAAVDGLRALVWVDLDAEGTPDLAALDARGRISIHLSQRAGRFAAAAAPPLAGEVLAIAAADLRASGRFGLLVLDREDRVEEWTLDDGGGWRRRPVEAPSASMSTTSASAYRGRDAAAAPSAPAAPSAARALPPSLRPGEARLLVGDLDRNGALDVVASVPGSSRVIGLALPLELPGRVDALADLDGDGLLDLVGIGPGGEALVWAFRPAATSPRYRHQVLRPRARDLRGDGRINSFGVGGWVELRAGTLVQRQPIAGPVVHFGLGERPRADVIRVVWPNGTWQAELDVAAGSAEVVSEQRLKGSCPFLFAWDGERMAFVTDLIWRSPLGLAINAQETAGVVQTEDRVRIPGERLRERAGRYDVCVTAELWETHFFDHLRLLAVDHPAGTEARVDERFAIPPPDLSTRIVERPRAFAQAWDDRGVDVADLVAARDGRRLDGFERGRYQGVAREHAVVLELPAEAPGAGPLWLVGEGWVHPTDSSINVAMGQGDHVRGRGLRLEVEEAGGGWRVVHADMGFPAGKEKTVLARLDGLFAGLGAGLPRRLRLSTSLEVYWDRLAWAVGRPDLAEAAAERVAPLRSAVLRYRGFSRIEAACAAAPELPEYDHLLGATPRWLDLEGFHTRFGPVDDLLAEVDDRYAILNAGDELALAFEALPPPAAGLVRTFVLVADGWVKDGDFHTAHGRTVLPLPSHQEPAYDRPLGPLEEEPVFRRHRADWSRFHTRWVRPRGFVDALRWAER